MQIVQCKCQSCGNVINLDLDNIQMYCSSCGNQLIIAMDTLEKMMLEKANKDRKRVNIERENLKLERKRLYAEKMRIDKQKEATFFGIFFAPFFDRLEELFDNLIMLVFISGIVLLIIYGILHG